MTEPASRANHVLIVSDVIVPVSKPQAPMRQRNSFVRSADIVRISTINGKAPLSMESDDSLDEWLIKASVIY